jgi:hypothetical protein
MRGAFDFGKAAVEFHKNILCDLLGQAAVCGHAEGERKDHRLVLVNEFFKVRLPVRGHWFRFYSLMRRISRVGMQGIRDGLKKVRKVMDLPLATL